MSDSVFSLDDEARLNLTQSTREKIIRDLTKDGKIPGETSDRVILMQALDGMDRTVLAKTKIKSDDRAQQQQTAATSLIAQLLTQTSVVRKKKTIQEITDVEIETPLLVEGELSVGADEQLNYNNFMNKMQDN